MQIRNRKSQSCSQFAVYPTVGWRFSSFLESLPEMKMFACTKIPSLDIKLLLGRWSANYCSCGAAVCVVPSQIAPFHHLATMPDCHHATPEHLSPQTNHLYCNLHCSSSVIFSSHQPALLSSSWLRSDEDNLKIVWMFPHDVFPYSYTR